MADINCKGGSLRCVTAPVSSPQQNFAVGADMFLAAILFTATVISIYGIILCLKNKSKPERYEKGKYRISLGLPALYYILISILPSFLFKLPEEFINIYFLDTVFAFLNLFTLVLIATIFSFGYKTWIKNRQTNSVLKKRGIMQMIFMSVGVGIWILHIFFQEIHLSEFPQ
jgi:hypothetical protein